MRLSHPARRNIVQLFVERGGEEVGWRLTGCSKQLEVDEIVAKFSASMQVQSSPVRPLSVCLSVSLILWPRLAANANLGRSRPASIVSRFGRRFGCAFLRGSVDAMGACLHSLLDGISRASQRCILSRVPPLSPSPFLLSAASTKTTTPVDLRWRIVERISQLIYTVCDN